MLSNAVGGGGCLLSWEKSLTKVYVSTLALRGGGLGSNFQEKALCNNTSMASYMTYILFSAKAPTARVIPSEAGVHLGKKLKLRCKARGRPRPRITWFKEGVRLRNGPHYRIRSRR